jgi:hypothetical protein
MLNKKSKKVMGRPKIGTQNEKAIFFAARFTPAEARELNAAIRQAKQVKSAWIRNCLLSTARRGTLAS